MAKAKRSVPTRAASKRVQQAVPKYFLRWFEKLPTTTRWTKDKFNELFTCKIADDYEGKWVIRFLRESDVRMGSGYFETLAHLRQETHINIAKAKKQFRRRRSLGIKTFVVVESGLIVATTSVLFEPKAIHNSGWIAHVEDVATMEGHGSHGFASELLRRAILAAIRMGCYKIILDCSLSKIPFYMKQGFLPIEMCMRTDL